MKINFKDITFSNQIFVIDSCVIISIFLEENQEIITMLNTLFNEGVGMVINEINLYETRYILKTKMCVENFDIDTLINNFINDYGIQVHKNSEKDFINASDIKSQGGLSPYDALMLAQMDDRKSSYLLITLDREFDKTKFTEKFDICLV